MKHLMMVCAGLLSLPCFGQVGAPLLGYVPDGTGIRAVYGMPASSSVARALDAGFARMESAGDYVLGSSSDTGEVAVYGLAAGRKLLKGAGRSPGIIAISPRGTSAALWFGSNGRIQVFTGLPDSAAEPREIDTAFLGRVPTALAISDDGNLVAGAWAGGLYAFGSSGEYQWLPVSDARALAFFPGSHDLAAASAQGIHRILDFGGRSELRKLLDEKSHQPRGLSVSGDGRQVVAVDVSGLVTSVQVDDGSKMSADCECRPTGLFRMNRTAFRITGMQQGAFKLFDAATGQILLAPIAAEEADAQ